MNTALRYDQKVRYPEKAPYDPGCKFPELTGIMSCSPSNLIYGLVRSVLLDAGLDEANRDTEDWSPLRGMIEPGQTVVIKPNWVHDTFEADRQDAVTTHASVIRPVVDYCWKAMDGQGKIIIADAPSAETDFQTVVRRSGAHDMVEILRSRGMNIELRDLRGLIVESKHGIWVAEKKRAYAAAESVIVDIGKSSCFAAPEFRGRVHGGGYGRHQTQKYHSGGSHLYCISRLLLQADLVIMMPKLKTHKKAGISCCLKNIVGINIDKNYLPHFSVGPANTGGDEYPQLSGTHIKRVRWLRQFHDVILDRAWKVTGRPVASLLGLIYRFRYSNHSDENALVGQYGGPGSQRKGSLGIADWLYRLASGESVSQGAWQGNETIWRMILDLNRIILYSNQEGIILKCPKRKILHLVDGVIAGGGNGPLNPDLVHCGLVAVGASALETDLAILRLASIDPEAIPLYREAVRARSWLSAGARVEEAVCNGRSILEASAMRIDLKEPDGWSYHANR